MNYMQSLIRPVKNNSHTPIEPNRYTLGNSRGASDILSAWNILQSVGIEGFQAYVANMLIVANVLADVLPAYGFTILEKIIHMVLRQSYGLPVPRKS